MISTNIRPPRPSEDSRLARLPAVKARILNSGSRNIGSATRVSMKQNATSTARPPKIAGCAGNPSWGGSISAAHTGATAHTGAITRAGRRYPPA